MSRWNSCRRRVFIKKVRSLGFTGPYSGANHEFMTYDNHRLTVPSNSEYSVPQLRMMIGQVEIILERKISADEWSGL